MSFCDCRGHFVNDKEMARRRSVCRDPQAMLACESLIQRSAASRDSDEVIHKMRRQAYKRINPCFLKLTSISIVLIIFFCQYHFKCIQLYNVSESRRIRPKGSGSSVCFRGGCLFVRRALSGWADCKIIVASYMKIWKFYIKYDTINSTVKV